MWAPDMDRYDFMAQALKETEKCYMTGYFPVGAFILKDGKIIATGRNLKERDNIGVLHAEIVAITNANKALGSTNLTGCEIYVTLEPCPMCSGAIINARIPNVYFGAYDKNFGCCGSTLNILELENSFHPNFQGGIMEEECRTIISEFFKNLRTKKEK